MATTRYLPPETKVLHISQGDTLTVLKRLTHGERQAIFGRQYQSGPDGLALRTAQLGLAKVTAYLLDWSLVGPDGKQVIIRDQPIEVLEAALNNLPPEDFDEIKEAIDAHENAMLAERALEKKLQSGANGSSIPPISPSVSTGVTSGLTHSTKTSTTSSSRN